MGIQPEDIMVEVYYGDPVHDRYFVKVIFLPFGMYINTFSVLPSKFEGKPYWVQQPKHKQGSIWKPTIDFDKSYNTWQIIEIKALDAVKRWKNTSLPLLQNSNDVVIDDIDDKPVSFEGFPY